MRSAIVLVALAVCAIVGSTGAMAQDYLPEIDALVSRGELRVGMIDREAPPMVVTTENGEPGGYDAEIASVIAAALGVELRIVRTETTYEGVVDQVARGDVDIGLSYLTRTAERARKVLFTRPYFAQKLTLLLSRVHAAQHGNRCPAGEEFVGDLDRIPTGAERDSAYAERLVAVNPEADLVLFEDFASMMDALRAGTIAVSFQGAIVARRYLADNPSQRVYATLCELPEWQENIAIAVNGAEGSLVPFLNVLLDSISISADGDTIRMTIQPF